MAKKPRIKKPKLPPLKKKLKGEVYVGNETEKMIIENKALKAKNDSLQRNLDSLKMENDSLKRVVKIRLK